MISSIGQVRGPRLTERGVVFLNPGQQGFLHRLGNKLLQAPPKEAICRTSVLLMWENSSLAITKTVSISASRVRFINDIRNSYSMSPVVRRPRSSTRASDLAGENHCQLVERLDVHVGQLRDQVSNQRHPFLQGEKGRFAGVDADTDHQAVEEKAAATDHIEVAEGDRVEHAGVDCASPLGWECHRIPFHTQGAAGRVRASTNRSISSMLL